MGNYGLKTASSRATGLKKARVQLLNSQTGQVIEDVDVLSSADCITFTDGQTFQQKLDNGLLKGDKGDKGDKGATGATGATGAKGATGATGATGVSLRLKGAWSSSTAYVNNTSYIDLVTANGNTYACKVSNTNQAVTNTKYWELIAQKGAKGDKGETGATGATGATGSSNWNDIQNKPFLVTGNTSLITTQDFNSIATGIYKCVNITGSNRPVKAYPYGFLESITYNGTSRQVYTAVDGNNGNVLDMWVRTAWESKWSPWSKITTNLTLAIQEG